MRAHDAAPWCTVAFEEIGTREASGDEDNPRVKQYHGATRGGTSPDSVPWCASFVNWCLEQVGVKGPRTKRARDFADWGRELSAPEPGSIAVLWRGKRDDGVHGHVGFVVWWDPERVWLLGGNQTDMVRVQVYPRSRVLHYVWPDVPRHTPCS